MATRHSAKTLAATGPRWSWRRRVRAVSTCWPATPSRRRLQHQPFRRQHRQPGHAAESELPGLYRDHAAGRQPVQRRQPRRHEPLPVVRLRRQQRLRRMGLRWNRRASTPLRVIWSVSTVAGCCATPGPAMRFGQLRYEGHGAVRMIAGRDIVSSGTGLGSERTASDNMGSTPAAAICSSIPRLPTCRWCRRARHPLRQLQRRGTGQPGDQRRTQPADERRGGGHQPGGGRRATRAPAPASSCRRAPARRTTPASSGVTWSSTTWRRQERPWRNSPARWYGSTKTN